MKRVRCLLLIAVLGFSSLANGAVSTANITSYVFRAISINKISDLNFGFGVPGDGQKSVLPQNTETNENASFLISGEPGVNFSVGIPSGDLTIVNGRGGTPQSEIKISNFKANSEGTITKLDENGQYRLYVGATRAAIRLDQVPGPYIGSFQVVVVY